MSEKGPAVLLYPDQTHDDEKVQTATVSAEDEDNADERKRQGEPRSPIAQMLYMRWLMNLREQCENRSCSESRFRAGHREDD